MSEQSEVEPPLSAREQLELYLAAEPAGSVLIRALGDAVAWRLVSAKLADSQVGTADHITALAQAAQIGETIRRARLAADANAYITAYEDDSMWQIYRNAYQSSSGVGPESLLSPREQWLIEVYVAEDLLADIQDINRQKSAQTALVGPDSA